jgi:citronellol/citronellal dehydrogenase
VLILAQTTVNSPAIPGTIQDAAAACVAAGGKALAIKTDVTDEAQVAAAVAAAVARFGGIDILINNASTHWPTRTADTDTRRYNTMMGVNLKGSYLVSRACMPHLQLSPNPHVLTIAPAPMADHTW